MKSKAEFRSALIGFFLLFSAFNCQLIAAEGTKQQRRDFYKKAQFVCRVHLEFKINFYDTAVKSSGTIAVPPSDVGSCSIIFYRKRKYIVTNAHVVTIRKEEIDQILRTFFLNVQDFSRFTQIQAQIISSKIHLKTSPGTSIEVMPKYINPDVDLALLDPINKNSYKKLRAAPLGDEKDIEVTDPVMNISNPGDLQFVFNSGSISKIARYQKNGRNYLRIITTPMTDRGSSGSPLLNEQGRCIGINYGGYFDRSIPYSIFIHVRDVKRYLKSIPLK